jgi:hypothetical protein
MASKDGKSDISSDADLAQVSYSSHQIILSDIAAFLVIWDVLWKSWS